MTGFGIAEDENFRVEIRSVNHRYIDISIKMPSYLNQYDIPLRNSIKERFRRGKFDIAISASNHSKRHLCRFPDVTEGTLYSGRYHH